MDDRATATIDDPSRSRVAWEVLRCAHYAPEIKVILGEAVLATTTLQYETQPLTANPYGIHAS
jgi:hypothetical protein